MDIKDQQQLQALEAWMAAQPVNKRPKHHVCSRCQQPGHYAKKCKSKSVAW